MAKRLAIPSDELKLRIVGPYDQLDIARVQRFTINKEVPSTSIYEIGNPQIAGTSLDTPNVTLTFSVFDVGVRTFAVLTGNDPANFPNAGVDISDLQEVDAIVFVKDASVSDYVKSAHAKRLQVRDFAFAYSVDGESTEDYTLIGSEARWFKNDVIVDRFIIGTTSFALSQTPIVLKNANYGLSVILDGAYLTEVTGAPGTGEYRIVGTTLTTGDSMASQVMAVYHVNPVGNNWADISEPQVPAATRGKDVKIEIAANNIPRVQNVSINGTLNTQAVKELGNTAVVGYQRQVPEVTGTIAVLDTDTELMDLLLNGSISSGDTEFEIGVECVSSGVDLSVKILDPCDASTVLKTVYIPEMILTGDAYASTVNQNATHTFNWRSDTAECIVYSGEP